MPIADMKLHHRYFPCDASDGPPLIVLHGLFGSRNNWSGAARRLAGRRDVFTLDLRNHGDSPHADRMTFPEMADDVAEFLAGERIPRAHLLGHSLGGKVAMQLAFDEPALLDKLIVVDIAPRVYPPRHESIFAAIDAIDHGAPDNRREADALIESLITDQASRLFLLTNLSVGDDGRMQWRVNTRAIRENYEAISAPPQVEAGASHPGPTLFIRGEKSPYIRAEDEPLIKRWFPRAHLQTLDAGHWIHVDAPEAFVATVDDFLQES